MFRFPSHNDSHCTFNDNSTAIAIAKVGYKFWCWIWIWCSGRLVTSPRVYLTWWICKITITPPKGKCWYDQWSCVGTSRWQKEFLPLRNSSEGDFFYKPQLVIIVMIIIFEIVLRRYHDNYHLQTMIGDYPDILPPHCEYLVDFFWRTGSHFALL